MDDIKIISGFTQFHQELFLLRFLSQTNNELTIITFSQKSKNYLINLLSHYKFPLNNINILKIDEINNDIKNMICYLSYFEKINQLEKTNLHLNINYLFISNEHLKILQSIKKINKQIILKKINPTEKELIKIKYLTKQVRLLTKKTKIAPELILTPGQIRLLSLIKLNQNELWKIPGLGTLWQQKWSSLIYKILLDQKNEMINHLSK